MMERNRPNRKAVGALFRVPGYLSTPEFLFELPLRFFGHCQGSFTLFWRVGCDRGIGGGDLLATSRAWSPFIIGRIERLCLALFFPRFGLPRQLGLPHSGTERHSILR